MGITADLSILGKLIIVLTMLFGKLGPLTLALSIAKQEKQKIKYDLHRRRYADNADGRAAGTADELDR